MKQSAIFLLALTIFTSCTPDSGPKKPLPLIGTWQLIAATSTERDSTYSTFNPNVRMIKMINETHFGFFSHALNPGKDSTAAFTAGGGEYTLSDSIYTERLQYFIQREWEGHEFRFTVTIRNDTLTQRGVEKLEKLGIDRIIEEKYVRIK